MCTLDTGDALEFELNHVEALRAAPVVDREDAKLALGRRMWKHHVLDGYDEWQGEDRSQRSRPAR